MNDTENLKEGRKHFILAVTFLAASFLLPFYIIRENRIVDGSEQWLYSLFLPSIIILITVIPLLIILGIIGPTKKIQDALKLVIPSLGLILIFFVYAELNTYYEPQFEAPGRIGVALGPVFYFLSLWVLISSSKKSFKIKLLSIIPPVVVLIILLAMNGFSQLGVVKEYLVFARPVRGQIPKFWQEVLNHLRISFTALGFAVLFGVSLGTAAFRNPKIRRPVFGVLNITQTIPSLALFGLMIIPLAALGRTLPFLQKLGVRGIGDTPAIIALMLYALFPIIKNTYVALSQVPHASIDAARGMGMDEKQIKRLVERPLASPVILNGIRLALVQTIGNTVVAKLVGAGGLGVFVFQGLDATASDLVMMGVISIVIFTFFIDAITRALLHIITPKALRLQQEEGH